MIESFAKLLPVVMSVFRNVWCEAHRKACAHKLQSHTADTHGPIQTHWPYQKGHFDE